MAKIRFMVLFEICHLDIKVSTDCTLKCPDLGDEEQVEIMTSVVSLV